MKQEKLIYSFEVTQKVEKSVSEKSVDESGAEITKTVKVAEDKPVKVILKRPTRRQESEADEEYSVIMSRMLKKGLFTHAMLANHIKNGTGGLMSEPDAEELVKLQQRLLKATEEYQLHKSTGGKKNKKFDQKEEELTKTIAEIHKELIEVQSRYQNLFNDTAEYKTQAKMILWYALNLSFFEDDGELTPVFPGANFIEKEDSYYNQEEDPSDLYSQIQKKLSYAWAIWYYNRAVTQEQLDKTIAGIAD